ncbi:hypothetical protein [Microbacterium sp. A1-JK]|uniref:hypothetical protein n=1 Tax=Microbacterium sp. A1-JK TaxID=3177516 RepID=UPI00388B4C3C
MMAIIVAAFPDWHPVLAETAQHFIDAPLNLEFAALAILGGAVITLMTRMQAGTESEPAKIVAAVAGGFILAGFQLFHSILDSLFAFGAIISGAPMTYRLGAVVPPRSGPEPRGRAAARHPVAHRADRRAVQAPTPQERSAQRGLGRDPVGAWTHSDQTLLEESKKGVRAVGLFKKVERLLPKRAGTRDSLANITAQHCRATARVSSGPSETAVTKRTLHQRRYIPTAMSVKRE